MHLIFERSNGRLQSNCNIIALAWMPYYVENEFRQALFEYHQKQLVNLGQTSNQRQNNNSNDASSRHVSGELAQNLRLRHGRNSNEVQYNDSNVQQQRQGSILPVDSKQYLNTRIAELYQRYLYSEYPQSGITKSNERVDASRAQCHFGSAINDDLDLKYGKLAPFGWLAVGNIGKIIGITLTSTVDPPDERDGRRSGSASDNNQDLMIFNDRDSKEDLQSDSSTAYKANSREKICTTDEHFNRIRPDSKKSRTNYNLRGHLDEIILVKWNELYQKLATVDSKGNVLIWCKLNDKFTIQTPFYNRTKTVADFKWSNDGKTALICYTDSFILVGSSSGQRHWHSMLNLEDYHITCASWTPNDEQLLFGVSNGNIVVIDLPQSELTEFVLNETTIRTMCWSSCDMNLSHMGKLQPVNQIGSSWENSRLTARVNAASNRRNPIVHQRRLSRDCSIFSRYRFCSQGPNMGNTFNVATNQVGELENSKSTNDYLATDAGSKQSSNILAIDFANNTIMLHENGLDDPEPKRIQVNLESYTLSWSSSGQTLAVAGFNVNTSTSSVGYLRCRYLNALKFFNQRGQLIYEHRIKYTRYPITAFTWAHNDRRIFFATGPRLHCAKVFFGVAPLSLLSMSSLHKATRLADKMDYLEMFLKQQHSNVTLHNWQSHNCPVDLYSDSKSSKTNRVQSPSCESMSSLKCLANLNYISDTDHRDLRISNNVNLLRYRMPSKLKSKTDEFFQPTIRQLCDDQMSLTDIVWQVPKNEQRFYCTLVCHTSDPLNKSSSASLWHQQRPSSSNRPDSVLQDQHSSEQYKIFILYVEFQGSLIPILRARRVGFLKPEFVIFDPEPDQGSRVCARPQRIHDSSSSHATSQPQVGGLSSCSGPDLIGEAKLMWKFNENCFDLHSCGAVDDLQHTNSPFSCHKSKWSIGQTAASRSERARDAYFQYLLNLAKQEPEVRSARAKRLFAGRDNVCPEISRFRRPVAETKSTLAETSELVRIRSNIWGTRFKIVNSANRMIKDRVRLGSITYKASLLHLQPRQIFLRVKDMTNYCVLCSTHHHSNRRTGRLAQAGSESKTRDRRTETPNLIDMSIAADIPADIIPQAASGSLRSTPLKSRRSRRSDETKRNPEDDKVVIPIGDRIRVAPKLERNQRYGRSVKSTTRQKSDLSSPQKGPTAQFVPSSAPSNRSCRRRRREQQLARDNSFSAKHSLDLADQPTTSRLEVSSRREDDILTLCLGQDDRLRVEMSSLNGTPRKAVRNTQDDQLEKFIGANKTLKSIQTITQMIVNLSAQAEDETAGAVSRPSMSSHVAADSNQPARQSSSDFVPPETPVHKPRRAKSNLMKSNPGTRYESDLSTPKSSKSRSNYSSPLATNRRRTREYHCSDLPAPLNPLPLPPPSIPLGKRITSSARRFLDGSLRSLSGSGYMNSEDDPEPEEFEPLVTSRRPSRRSQFDALRSKGCSQPTTPLRHLESASKKKSSLDFSALRGHLVEKLRTSSIELNQSLRLKKPALRKPEQAMDPVRVMSINRSASSSSSSSSCSTSSDESTEDLQHLAHAAHELHGRFASEHNLSLIENRGQSNARNHKRMRRDRRRGHNKLRRKCACNNANCSCAKELRMSNRPPVWNEVSQVYQLDFGGRVTQESAKNLQIDFNGSLALQFGRIDKCTYTLDYKYPFNAVQAMAVVLASLTQRMK